MMPSLIIDHLSIDLRSGTGNLVSEISFAIKEGESLILLGQSGSGKTMTCSAVLNLGQFTRNYTQTTKRGLLTTNKG